MSNIIAIHQPNYIPWLGYFYKIYQAETFVFLDSVQYTNKGLHDYHYIKTPQGRLRLKIPVKCNFGDNISEVRINDLVTWRKNQLKQIASNYKKAAYFNLVFPDLEVLYNAEFVNLSEFNINIIRFIATKFNFKTKFVTSSQLLIETSDKNERIFKICETLHATCYYSGIGAKVYQNEADFNLRNIELKYSTFKPFEYPQFWGEFESNISVIDYLMHCGYDWQRVLDSQI